MRIFALFVLLGLAPLAGATDRVIGLLTLPQVMGDGPCDRFTPQEVPLYRDAAGAEQIGLVRVDRPWHFPATGGCEGLLVNVHLVEGQRVVALPTREFEYEAPAAVVLERHESWFRLKLDSDSAWVEATEANTFHSLEDLVMEGLSYLTEAFDGQLYEAPGAGVAPAETLSGQSVRVLESVRRDGLPWLQVQVMSHSACDAGDDPRSSHKAGCPRTGLRANRAFGSTLEAVDLISIPPLATKNRRSYAICRRLEWALNTRLSKLIDGHPSHSLDHIGHSAARQARRADFQCCARAGQTGAGDQEGRAYRYAGSDGIGAADPVFR
jgi:hypothetical protein